MGSSDKLEFAAAACADLTVVEFRAEAADGGAPDGQPDHVRRIKGYASITGRQYQMPGHMEVIERGAFAATLAADPDVLLRIEHGGPGLARTTAGSLRLSEDERGLAFEADLDLREADAATIWQKIRRRVVTDASIAFRARRFAWDGPVRSVSEADLDRGDVSIVGRGANRAAGLAAASEDGASEPEPPPAAADSEAALWRVERYSRLVGIAA